MTTFSPVTNDGVTPPYAGAYPSFPAFAFVGAPSVPPPGTDGSGKKGTYVPINPLPGNVGVGSWAMALLLGMPGLITMLSFALQR